MTFAGLSAWAVAAIVLASAGALALLHLLRVRPHTVRVITTLFWAQAVERSLARTLLHRFRHPLTYALLLAICALLALALGRPQRRTSPPDRVHEVLILDAAASMSAPDAGGRTRLDVARARARGEADDLGLDDRFAVIVADPWPRLVHAFDDARPMADIRLRDVRPAGASASPRPALTLAQSLLNGRTHPRIVVLTDRPAEWTAAEKSIAALESKADAPAQTPAVAMRVVPIGEPADNAGIVSALYVPDAADPLRGRFVVRVAHAGPQPRSLRVDVQRAGGGVLGSRDIDLPPTGTQDVVLTDVPADGDELVVSLDHGDGVAADDRAAFRLPRRSAIRVRLDPRTPAPLVAAIQADPAVRVVDAAGPSDVRVVAGAAALNDAATGDGASLAIIDDGAPATPGERVRIASEHAWTTGLVWEAAVCGAGPVLATGDADADPREPAADAGDASKPADNADEPLLVVDAGPVAIVRRHGTTRHVLLSAALLSPDSTVWRRPAFGVFVARAVRDLAGWSADPLVLPAWRVIEDPLVGERLAATTVTPMPGERADEGEAISAAAGAPPSTQPSSPAFARRGGLALFEWLLAGALALAAVEAVLHVRGRIS